MYVQSIMNKLELQVLVGRCEDFCRTVCGEIAYKQLKVVRKMNILRNRKILDICQFDVFKCVILTLNSAVMRKYSNAISFSYFQKLI
jgi:hypothetical protein